EGGESANGVVKAAGLVCFVGTEAGGMTPHSWAVPNIGPTAIQIDIDPEALGRNCPLVAGVNGDAKVTLARMLAAADRGSAAKRKAWVEEAQKICREWRGGTDERPRPSTPAAHRRPPSPPSRR